MADPRDQHEEEQVEDVAAKAEESKEKATKADAEAKPKRARTTKKKAEGSQKAEGGRQKAGKAKDEAAAEAKPKRTRKKAEPKADEAKADEAKAEESKADDAAEEPSADEVAEKAKTDEVDKPKRRRRGAAEVSASESRKPAARRAEDGKVIVRAKARYVRTAPRKARLVVDHIRGKSVDEARAILIHTPRAASRDVLKLLDSAIANAENNHELVADELKIDRVFVDEGPTLKRFRPRALGRATQIRKRTSHMTILLTPKE
jgi:ribosomal protein L22